MISDVNVLDEPNVNYAGVARWPLNLSVNPIRWAHRQPILTAVWGMATAASAVAGFFYPAGVGVAALLVLAGLYYWFRVWKNVYYSCLLPAVVISTKPLRLASYANLAQTKKLLPAIKISELASCEKTLGNVEVGSRIICIGRFDPAIVGFKWANFHAIPLAQLISNRSLIQASKERLPEHLWEALEIGLGTIDKPELGLYELPTDILVSTTQYGNTELDDEAAATSIQKRATKKNLSLYYGVTACLVIGVVGLSIYSRMNLYSASIRSGDAAFKSGNFAKAYEYYEKAIRHDPKRPSAYFHRAIVYQKAGDHRKAQMDFNDLLKLKPTFGPGYRLRAMSLRALRLDEAATQDALMADKLGADKTIADPFLIMDGLEP